ncbi:MAG: glutamate 5-kinase [Pseudomonadales bacterium]|jgi:glutamate 5-kinase
MSKILSFDPGKIWVVKIGSSLLTDNGQGLAVDLVNSWVNDIVDATTKGIKIVIVSSGAVAEGMLRLGLKNRPKSVHLLQAAAAVGQMGLIQLYESSFQRHGMHTAQVLLTHDDLRSRERYLNARSTLRNLLDMGVIPIVNENDTVVTDEIRFGDNDTLAALVANLIGADTLILLTDQRGLYSSDPRSNSDAQLIHKAKASDPELDRMAGQSGSQGRGGMVTKIKAARIAARSGANTLIASGRAARVIQAIGLGDVPGSLLTADMEVLVSRKQWLATLSASGKLVLDQGAVEVLRDKGRSLLAVGVLDIEGNFTRGEMVACVDENGREVARGLINYNRSEAAKIIGKTSSNIEKILGYLGDEELIHRDNMLVG